MGARFLNRSSVFLLRGFCCCCCGRGEGGGRVLQNSFIAALALAQFTPLFQFGFCVSLVEFRSLFSDMLYNYCWLLIASLMLKGEFIFNVIHVMELSHKNSIDWNKIYLRKILILTSG